MTDDDLVFDELLPGRYHGTVEKVRYIFMSVVTYIVISYRLDMPHGEIRRIKETLLLAAPPSSASYYQTALGKGRVEAILRTKGLSLADARADGGLRALPGVLEGSAICVITKNRWTAGFNCPVVVRIEAVEQ